jgi:PAS domain S-box-containing protein
MVAAPLDIESPVPPRTRAAVPRPTDFQLGVLFERGLDAVVVADVEEGRIVLWNPAAERLFGYTSAEAVGSPLEILMAEGLGHVHRAGLERYRRSGHGLIIDSGKPVEVPARTKRGDDIRVELRLSPVQSRQGSYVLGVMRDVTDRKRIELMQFELARAHAARQQIEAAVVARDEFLTSLADNPSVERLDRFSRALVDLKLIDSDQLILHIEEADLAQVVRQEVALARHRARGHRLVTRGPSCVLVECDAVRMAEVVDNLVDNAICHNTNPCLIEVRIVRPNRDVVELTVRDHGVGIPHERRARLFERYYHGKRVGPGTGAGLGLHVCRKLVELHGGTLEASFPPTGGVCMTARLPMR